MKEGTARRLDKAERAIRAARVQRDAGLPEFAVSDAYYALFYVAEALLLERGMTFRSHGTVHGAYGREFTKPGVLDRKHHRHLLDAFELRVEADYMMDAELPDGAVDEVIGWAEAFLEEAQDWLNGEVYKV